MKYVKQMFALALLLIPVAGFAQSTTSDKVVTKVPFEFMAANRFIPAGQCTVQWHDRTLRIGNAGAKVSVFAIAVPTEARESAETYALIFHRYGDRYFLSGVRIGGSRTIYEVLQSKAELELRSQNVMSTETLLASR